MTIQETPRVTGVSGTEVRGETSNTSTAPERALIQPRFTASDPRVRALRLQGTGTDNAAAPVDEPAEGTAERTRTRTRSRTRETLPVPPAPLPHPDHLPAGDPVDWPQMLDALEQDLERAEALLDAASSTDGQWPEETELPGGAAAWSPPTALGELPPECIERAREVLARQGRIRERLRDAAADVHRQRGFTNRVFSATVSRAAPVYLDVTA